MHLTMATKSTVGANLRGDDRGKTAAYRLQWANTQGENGPWSEIATATLAM